MKKLLLFSLVIIACSCKKELTDSLNQEDAENLITIKSPFLEKISLQLTPNAADSAVVQKPENYNFAPATKFPLLIFFHGTGEARNDGGLQALLRLGPPRFMSDSIRLGNFITLCPQDEDGYRTADNINLIINAAIKKYRVDTNRIYLTGLSAGGRNVMNYVTEKPAYAKRIAAVAPMSVIDMNKAHTDNFNYFARYGVHCRIYVGDSDKRYFKDNVNYNNAINKFDPQMSQLITYKGAHSGWNKVYKPDRAKHSNVYDWIVRWSRQ